MLISVYTQRVTEAHLQVPFSVLCYEYEVTITTLKTLRLFAHFTLLYQVLMVYRMVDSKVVLACIQILMFEAKKITKRLKEG
jgi:hypothetical protein